MPRCPKTPGLKTVNFCTQTAARMDYLMLTGVCMYTAYIQCVRYSQRREGDGGRQPFVLVCPGVHTESIYKLSGVELILTTLYPL